MERSICGLQQGKELKEQKKPSSAHTTLTNNIPLQSQPSLIDLLQWSLKHNQTVRFNKLAAKLMANDNNLTVS